MVRCAQRHHDISLSFVPKRETLSPASGEKPAVSEVEGAVRCSVPRSSRGFDKRELPGSSRLESFRFLRFTWLKADLAYCASRRLHQPLDGFDNLADRTIVGLKPGCRFRARKGVAPLALGSSVLTFTHRCRGGLMNSAHFVGWIRVRTPESLSG